MALVAFLRGVNVGGHRTFRPKALAAELEHLGVVNVGAAGTFVARERIGQRQLRAELARRLPFDTEIVICKGRDIVRVLSTDVFGSRPEPPGVVRFVSVLSRRPSAAPALPMRLPVSGPWLLELLARENRFLYGRYRRDTKTIRYLGTLDRAFGVPVTTRNWNTLTTIARVLEDGPTR